MMVELDEELATYVLEHCPGRTDEALRDRFGISYNTLRKIEAGAPLRNSVVARLKERIGSELRTGQDSLQQSIGGASRTNSAK
jgi:hypothetical protein